MNTRFVIVSGAKNSAGETNALKGEEGPSRFFAPLMLMNVIEFVGSGMGERLLFRAQGETRMPLKHPEPSP